jgi:UPF0042 nucleotide-binding protein
LELDERFLDTPYFVPTLKHLPGTDAAVVKYVMDLPETKEFVAKTRELLAYVMPKYEREGKSYLTIAIGCTGGRHRSVVVADVLGRLLEPVIGASITVVHRDVDRAGGATIAVVAPPASDSERSLSMTEQLGVAQPLGYGAHGERGAR